LADRPSLAYLFRLRMVERFVILSRSRGVGTIEEIIDGKSLQPVEVGSCLN
ncbi:MAG: stage III sporulation protein AA, partial [Peptococcaceae bacterium]